MVNTESRVYVPDFAVSTEEHDAAIEIVRNTVTPEQVEELEGKLLELPQVDVPVTHHFQDGIYMREITLPAGTIAIGASHVSDCINMMLTGCMSLMVGGEMMELRAPAIFTGKARERKVAYTKERSTFVTIHATTETNVDVLDATLTTKSDTLKAYERRKLEEKALTEPAIVENEPIDLATTVPA